MHSVAVIVIRMIVIRMIVISMIMIRMIVIAGGVIVIGYIVIMIAGGVIVIGYGVIVIAGGMIVIGYVMIGAGGIATDVFHHIACAFFFEIVLAVLFTLRNDSIDSFLADVAIIHFLRRAFFNLFFLLGSLRVCSCSKQHKACAEEGLKRFHKDVDLKRSLLVCFSAGATHREQYDGSISCSCFFSGCWRMQRFDFMYGQSEKKFHHFLKKIPHLFSKKPFRAARSCAASQNPPYLSACSATPLSCFFFF
jgi:hypothetical protein